MDGSQLSYTAEEVDFFQVGDTNQRQTAQSAHMRFIGLKLTIAETSATLQPFGRSTRSFGE